MSEKKSQVSQEQIHGILFGEKLSWQALIYDLINTEQLNVWDIDISLLAQKYLEKVRALEEENFFVSSKVLLAAALLLRMKSEILLHEYIPSLDSLLFGEKEQKKYVQERITLDDEIPDLVARTPLPRFRKVTLEELMQALGKAISTETRRIQRIVVAKQQEFETSLSMPKRRINIQDKIREVYTQLQGLFKEQNQPIAFSELAGKSSEERIATFIPLLHLDTQQKIWLEQDGHFSEIWILLKHLYEKQHAPELESMRKEAEAALQDLSAEEQKRAEEVEDAFENPLV